MAHGGPLLTPPTPNQILFARNFLRVVNKNEELRAQNLLISPAGARSALTLVFMAAGGKTASELRSGLMLGPAKKMAIAKQHAESISKDCVCNEKGASIRLATGLYITNEQDLHPNFNSQAGEFFNTRADTLNFLDAVGSMHQVNSWLQRQTFNTVHKLLTPDAFTLESRIFLVNTVYFRAKWTKRFPEKNTMLGDFTISAEQKMQLPMMRQIGEFRFGESKKLNSRILQLPFEESDLSLLLILPLEELGISELESKLEKFDLNEVAQKSVMHDVDVTLPRFKIECDVDLKEPLKKLGVKRIFKNGVADLKGLFAKKAPHPITEARQKLSLSINEAGCTTNIDESTKNRFVKANPERKVFVADHPFVFAIRNNKIVYFVGHFVRP
ncbi:serine protease inhibitor 42Dd [Drosophila mojavensis]|uniref:Serpin domain-containing protein n=1 Tax=Drosophila mojavensis TaxID=7230 RepID=B4KPZ0_DROMO|nr:serine protease inhibitor 42Dd [Drosophila mojavensis]XP_043866821.1 serine protease inhibitor 42Dd [Drosophila mojavensis]EDW08092.1 uncharacterized protein Dmoj_GI19760 [Drosophila mojavensis]